MSLFTDTVAAQLGEPVEAAGLFRTKTRVRPIPLALVVLGGLLLPFALAIAVAFVASILIVAWYKSDRKASKSPPYIIIVLQRSAVQIHRAGRSYGRLDGMVAQYGLDLVAASRSGAWDVVIATPDRTFNLTCVSCDEDAHRLLAAMAPIQAP